GAGRERAHGIHPCGGHFTRRARVTCRRVCPRHGRGEGGSRTREHAAASDLTNAGRTSTGSLGRAKVRRSTRWTSALQPVSLDLFVERRDGDAEGARGCGFVAAHPFERLPDGFAFDALEGKPPEGEPFEALRPARRRRRR